MYHFLPILVCEHFPCALLICHIILTFFRSILHLFWHPATVSLAVPLAVTVPWCVMRWMVLHQRSGWWQSPLKFYCCCTLTIHIDEVETFDGFDHMDWRLVRLKSADTLLQASCCVLVMIEDQ
eukprot:260284_1